MAEIGLDLGPHAAFIWAAYACVAGALAALTSWIVVDERRQRRRISELEAQGVARRSARPAAAPAKTSDGKPPAKKSTRRKAPRKTAAKQAPASGPRAKGRK